MRVYVTPPTSNKVTPHPALPPKGEGEKQGVFPRTHCSRLLLSLENIDHASLHFVFVGRVDFPGAVFF